MGNNECILCGTNIEEDYCVECAHTADELGLDYEEIMSSF
jgi:hypothetical protein